MLLFLEEPKKRGIAHLAVGKKIAMDDAHSAEMHPLPRQFSTLVKLEAAARPRPPLSITTSNRQEQLPMTAALGSSQ